NKTYLDYLTYFDVMGELNIDAARLNQILLEPPLNTEWASLKSSKKILRSVFNDFFEDAIRLSSNGATQAGAPTVGDHLLIPACVAAPGTSLDPCTKIDIPVQPIDQGAQ
ncbi:MAG: hypothetical protein CMP10_03100, partial [Zetaproteobacteria bacterium]|nr:hypothetical protein [Pseudobdellovibrionaceae bacterium]